jgi:hypothetical protein
MYKCHVISTPHPQAVSIQRFATTGWSESIYIPNDYTRWLKLANIFACFFTVIIRYTDFLSSCMSTDLPRLQIIKLAVAQFSKLPCDTHLYFMCVGRDSSVGIATPYRVEGPGILYCVCWCCTAADVLLEMYCCWCTAGDVPLLMNCWRCTAADVLLEMYRCWCTAGDVLLLMYCCYPNWWFSVLFPQL